MLYCNFTLYTIVTNLALWLQYLIKVTYLLNWWWRFVTLFQ